MSDKKRTETIKKITKSDPDFIKGIVSTSLPIPPPKPPKDPKKDK